MVAAMNAKKPRGREKSYSYTYINDIYTLILIGSDRMLTYVDIYMNRLAYVNKIGYYI